MYDWNTMVRFEHPPPFLYIEARALLQCVEVRNIHIVSSVEARGAMAAGMAALMLLQLGLGRAK